MIFLKLTRRICFNENTLFWVGIVVGLVLSWWYGTNQIMGGDQLQMIHKGYLGAYKGVWMSFGNTASVVGNVPGSLLALVVGVPLYLWDSPYAPMLLLIFLRLVGFLMLDGVVRKVYPDVAMVRLVFLLLCWLNPWFLFDSLLYNPSYLIFCAGLHCWTAWHMQRERRFIFTLLHVFSIGIAIQLHFSWPILVVLSGLLFYRRLLKIHWLAVGVALVLLLLSLLPYLMQLSANPSLAFNEDPETQDRYIGWGAVHVYPVLKATIYWLRYGSWAFPSKLVNETNFLWLHFPWLSLGAEYAWKFVLLTFGGVTLVISLIANIFSFKHIRHGLKRSSGTEIAPTQWMLMYATAAFLAVLASAGMAPLVFNYWHLTLIFPFALFPVLYWVFKYLDQSVYVTYQSIAVVFVILLIINLVALNDSRKFSYAVDYAQQTIEYVNQHIGSRERS